MSSSLDTDRTILAFVDELALQVPHNSATLAAMGLVDRIEDGKAARAPPWPLIIDRRWRVTEVSKHDGTVTVEGPGIPFWGRPVVIV